MTAIGIGDLPPEILLRILDFLRLRDGRRALASSKSLWSLRTELEAKFGRLTVPTSSIRTAIVSTRFIPRSDDEDESEQNTPASVVSMHQTSLPLKSCLDDAASFFGGLGNLVELDVGGLATDHFLEVLSGVGYSTKACPDSTELIKNLKKISMVGSADLTDRGLEYLGLGSDRAQNLREIDLTFCRSTTYAGTFPLRDQLHNLSLIRRQPEWLDGSFVTPFKGSDEPNSGEEGELHTYWADGTFAFNRRSQSEGFVADLFPLEEDSEEGGETDSPRHLGDCLQYTDFDPPPSWPGWAKYCYRPGVSLLRLPCDDLEDGNYSAGEVAGKKSCATPMARSVLVAQRLEGLRAPPDAPDAHMHCVDLVPLGESRTFDRSGDIISDLDNGIEHAARHPLSHTLISRMKVLPLPYGGKLMPPSEVLERNRAFCDEMKRAAEPEGALSPLYRQASAVRETAILSDPTGLGDISPAGKVDPLSAALDFGENLLHSALLQSYQR